MVAIATRATTRSAADKLVACETIVGHKFTKINLLREALNGHTTLDMPQNRRLAVLGDALASAQLAARWISTPLTPGEWARIESSALCNANLGQVGVERGLDHCIDGPVGPVAVATTIEAIIGAAYLDGGPKAVTKIMDNLGLTHGLLELHGPRAWTMRAMKTTKKLRGSFFAGKQLEMVGLMSQMDRSFPTPPRDRSGKIISLPLNLQAGTHARANERRRQSQAGPLGTAQKGAKWFFDLASIKRILVGPSTAVPAIIKPPARREPRTLPLNALKTVRPSSKAAKAIASESLSAVPLSDNAAAKENAKPTRNAPKPVNRIFDFTSIRRILFGPSNAASVSASRKPASTNLSVKAPTKTATRSLPVVPVPNKAVQKVDTQPDKVPTKTVEKCFPAVLVSDKAAVKATVQHAKASQEPVVRFAGIKRLLFGPSNTASAISKLTSAESSVKAPIEAVTRSLPAVPVPNKATVKVNNRPAIAAQEPVKQTVRFASIKSLLFGPSDTAPAKSKSIPVRSSIKNPDADKAAAKSAEKEKQRVAAAAKAAAKAAEQAAEKEKRMQRHYELQAEHKREAERRRQEKNDRRNVDSSMNTPAAAGTSEATGTPEATGTSEAAGTPKTEQTTKAAAMAAKAARKQKRREQYLARLAEDRREVARLKQEKKDRKITKKLKQATNVEDSAQLGLQKAEAQLTQLVQGREAEEELQQQLQPTDDQAESDGTFSELVQRMEAETEAKQELLQAEEHGEENQHPKSQADEAEELQMLVQQMETEVKQELLQADEESEGNQGPNQVDLEEELLLLVQQMEAEANQVEQESVETPQQPENQLDVAEQLPSPVQQMEAAEKSQLLPQQVQAQPTQEPSPHPQAPTKAEIKAEKKAEIIALIQEQVKLSFDVSSLNSTTLAGQPKGKFYKERSKLLKKARMAAQLAGQRGKAVRKILGKKKAAQLEGQEYTTGTETSWEMQSSAWTSRRARVLAKQAARAGERRVVVKARNKEKSQKLAAYMSVHGGQYKRDAETFL